MSRHRLLDDALDFVPNEAPADPHDDPPRDDPRRDDRAARPSRHGATPHPRLPARGGAQHRRPGHRAAEPAAPGRGLTGRILGGGKRRRTALVVMAATVAMVGLPSAGVAAADQCRWMRAAHQLFLTLDGPADARTAGLRDALARAGVSRDLPAECARGRGSNPTPTSKPTAAPAPSSAPSTTKKAPAAGTSTSKPTPSSRRPTTAPAPQATDTGTGTSAAEKFGWGTPVQSDDFSGDLSAWSRYDGVGHAGNGRRTPAAVSVSGGLLTITGDSKGSTGGMAWGSGQKYGRWEGRVKAPASDPSYNALLLLWSDAENFPVGGEIDFMEMSDHTRQTTETFLHYGRSNSQVSGKVSIDATQWHNWAVEWTPDHVATFVDGKEWFRTTDRSILPPGPMHMTIQLDWFPKGGSATPSQMQVDWVKQYAL